MNNHTITKTNRKIPTFELIMEIYCKKCNEKVSAMKLQLVDSNQANHKETEDLIGEGLYLIAGEIDIHFGQKIDFLVNRKSVTLHNHKDRKKLSGCCGPGDLGVLNQVCPKCSAEIGVLIEDCWLPHFIGISQETVRFEPLW